LVILPDGTAKYGIPTRRALKGLKASSFKNNVDLSAKQNGIKIVPRSRLGFMEETHEAS